MALSLQYLSLSSYLVYFVQSEQLIDYLLPILTVELLVCHMLCKRRCSLYLRPLLPDAYLPFSCLLHVFVGSAIK